MDQKQKTFLIENKNDLPFRVFFFDEEELSERLKGYCIRYGLCETEKALSYGSERHKGQYRKKNLYSEEEVPYFVHPLIMACHGAAMGIRDDAVLAAALLHDTAEDTGIRAEELPFSEGVRKTVGYLTFAKLPSETRREAKKRYYEEMRQDPAACLIKLLDRCSNLTTMAGSFSEKRMLEYIDEAERYILPLSSAALKAYPEYEDAVFLLKYQILSLIETIKYMIQRGK